MSHELTTFVTALTEGDTRRTNERNQAENTLPNEHSTVEQTELRIAGSTTHDEKVRSLRQQLSRLNGISTGVHEAALTPDTFDRLQEEALRLLWRIQQLSRSAETLLACELSPQVAQIQLTEELAG